MGQDLSGKTVHDLDRVDFEKLFCQHCHEYEECPRDYRKIMAPRVFTNLLRYAGCLEYYLRHIC